MRILLVATYELGQQPGSLGTAAAHLRAAGHDVRAVDVSVDDWDAALATWADEVAFSVPMHTATRLARDLAATSPAPSTRPVRVRSGSIADQCTDFATPGRLGRPDPGAATCCRRSTGTPGSRSAASSASSVRCWRRTGARTAAGTARCRSSTTAGSAGSTRTRCSPTSRSWSRPARATSPSATPTSSTRRRTRGASCGRCTSGSPTSPSTARSRSSTSLRHDDLWPELADAGCLFVVSAFESVDDDGAGPARQGPHRGRRRGAPSRCCATRASTSGRRGCRSRRGPPATTSSRCSTSCTTTTSSAASTRCSTAIRLLLPTRLAAARSSGPRPAPRSLGRGAVDVHVASADPAVDELQQRLAALVEARRRRAATSTRRCAGRGRRAAVDLTDATTGRPRLTESWFCCAEPTELQLHAVSCAFTARPVSVSESRRAMNQLVRWPRSVPRSTLRAEPARNQAMCSSDIVCVVLMSSVDAVGVVHDAPRPGVPGASSARPTMSTVSSARIALVVGGVGEREREHALLLQVRLVRCGRTNARSPRVRSCSAAPSPRAHATSPRRSSRRRSRPRRSRPPCTPSRDRAAARPSRRGRRRRCRARRARTRCSRR